MEGMFVIHCFLIKKWGWGRLGGKDGKSDTTFIGCN